MKTYSFEPEKTNAKKYAFLASLFGLIFICTKVGLKSSVFVVFFYIIFMIIAFAENFNIKNSRFELQENKLDHYIKSKLVRSFDLNNDSLAITTFNHGHVLIIRQKIENFNFMKIIWVKKILTNWSLTSLVNFLRKNLQILLNSWRIYGLLSYRISYINGYIYTFR